MQADSPVLKGSAVTDRGMSWRASLTALTVAVEFIKSSKLPISDRLP